VPIDVLCKAKIDDIKGFMLPMLQKYFTVSHEEEKDDG
jgi:hypothetical protein